MTKPEFGSTKNRGWSGRGTHVEGGDGPGGLAGDELDLDVKPAEEVALLGLQPRARPPVQRQLHLPPAVAEPRIALPPCHVEVPPEVMVPRRRRRGQREEEEEGRPAQTGGAHA